MSLSKSSLLSLLDTPLQEVGVGAHNIKAAKKLGYVRIPGVINLSYSRRQTLHSCPRKFLQREIIESAPIDHNTIHTAFGSSWGAGLQELFLTGSIERATIAILANWSVSTEEFDGKSGKSLWTCVDGIHHFYKHHFPRISEEYEVAIYNGKPCIELFFYIRMGQQFSYQGHIDLIMRHKRTGALVVWEFKTSGYEQHEANWANSEQTLGYSLIVDMIAEHSSDYRVHYLIFNPKHRDSYEENFGVVEYEFGKSQNSKAEFITDLGLDIQLVQTYLKVGLFPKRGGACRSFNRTCEFFGTCDLEIKQLHDVHQTSAGLYESMTLEDVDFLIDIGDVIAKQKSVDKGQDFVTMIPEVAQSDQAVY